MGTWPNCGIRALPFSATTIFTSETRRAHRKTEFNLLRGLRACVIFWDHGIFAILVLLPVLLLPHQGFAQDGSSALNGVVEDLTGARVASAAVAVANPENGFHREAVADAAGNFSFGMLLPGRYVVSAWAKGMATQTASV